MTRAVDGNESCELCPQCYDASGVENEMSDEGETPERLAEWEKHLAECRKRGGNPPGDKWWRGDR